MKRNLLSLLLILASALCLSVALTACGGKKEETEPPMGHWHNYVANVCTVCNQHKPSDGVAYVPFNESSYAVSGIGSCEDSEVYIAETYGENYLPVTNIMNNAFEGCGSFTNVILPESITKIGEKAFSGCSNLTEITIPASVTQIGEGAFSDCGKLGDISVSQDNLNFSSKDGNVYDKDGKTLVQYATGKQITSFTVPDGVTHIGASAFYGSSKLIYITLPNGIEEIGDSAFYDCNILKTINLPNGLKKIGSCAFYNCGKLNKVTIPQSVTQISDRAFACCGSLSSIAIPAAAKGISASLFYNCGLLMSVVIPDGITAIGSYAFWGCESLTQITIPASVTRLGNYAFKACTDLENFYYTGTKAQWAAIKKGGAWNDKIYVYTVHCSDGDLSKNES